MKRQFIKKLATVTVSAAMLAALFSGGINAGIWTAQAQETNVAAASEQFDTTAPVVESISIDKQGQNVGDDDTFKITIKAYDSESGPYLAPVPNRGKRNDSSNIRYVIEKLAEIKKMSYDEIVDITNNNARRLFFKEA